MDHESGVVFLFFVLFKMCHRTRLRVAMESSTEEWPVDPPPLWIDIPMCSFALAGHDQRTLSMREGDSTDRSLKDRLYGRPAL